MDVHGETINRSDILSLSTCKGGYRFYFNSVHGYGSYDIILLETYVTLFLAIKNVTKNLHFTKSSSCPRILLQQ